MDSEKPNEGAKSTGDVRPHTKKSPETVSLEIQGNRWDVKPHPHFKNIYGHHFSSGGRVQGTTGVKGEEFVKPSLDKCLNISYAMKDTFIPQLMTL